MKKKRVVKEENKLNNFEEVIKYLALDKRYSDKIVLDENSTLDDLNKNKLIILNYLELGYFISIIEVDNRVAISYIERPILSYRDEATNNSFLNYLLNFKDYNDQVIEYEILNYVSNILTPADYSYFEISEYPVKKGRLSQEIKKTAVDTIQKYQDAIDYLKSYFYNIRYNKLLEYLK